MNAELQRRARRDKKAFLSDQCKEIEENNRMEKPEIFGNGKTYLQEILRCWGVFHAKMCTIKDRNDMDLTEAEEVARIHRTVPKKKKFFMTQITRMV